MTVEREGTRREKRAVVTKSSRLRIAAMVALVSFLQACDDGLQNPLCITPGSCSPDRRGTENPTGPSSEVVVRIDPEFVNVQRTARLHFNASVSFPEGDSRRDSGVVWTIREGDAGGTIDQEGNYKAPPQLGRFNVVATSVEDPKASATAVVHVGPSLEIIPKALTLSPHGRQRFNARVIGIDDPRVIWSLDEGVGLTTALLSSDGVFVPAVEGVFHVRATSAVDPDLTGVAKVVVTTDIAPVLVPSPETPSMQPVMVDSVRFLYEGDGAIQLGVDQGTIRDGSVAILRGRVRDTNGGALPGTLVSIVGRPEYGTTRTQMDGSFDFAVNGGSVLALEFALEGYLPIQRTVEPTVLDWISVGDVVLSRFDFESSYVNLSAPLEAQFAWAAAVEDSDGRRQTSAYFPAGIEASMTLPNGVVVPLEEGTFRVTEYTIGESGPEAMPGELPPGVEYTWAAEFGFDEAVEAGAIQVNFSKPVITYVDNFLGFAPLTTVPSGYYDRVQSRWVPSTDGIVLRLIGVDENGYAQVEGDDGAPLSPHLLNNVGITYDEQKMIARQFLSEGGIGTEIWRVPLDHFTPCDYNFPAPGDAAIPMTEASADCEDFACTQPGSIIECENQTIGEIVAIPGTEYSLTYWSDRVPGRRPRIRIPLTGAQAPPDVQIIEVQVFFAGHEIIKKFNRIEPNMHHMAELPTHDRYGRRLFGTQFATVKTIFHSARDYANPPEWDGGPGRSFGEPGDGSTDVPGRILFRTYSTQRVAVPFKDSRPLGLGGWHLSPHHVFDNEAGMLWLGDGSRRLLRNVTGRITKIAGYNNDEAMEVPLDGGEVPTNALNTDMTPNAVLPLPGGEVLIADGTTSRIYHVNQSGETRVFAGRQGAAPGSGLGGKAVDAGLYYLLGLAQGSGSDQSIYVIDDYQIRQIDQYGTIRAFAGSGEPEGSAPNDGERATSAGMTPVALSVANNGDVYFASGKRVRYVTNGRVKTAMTFNGEVTGVVATPEGDVYAIGHASSHGAMNYGVFRVTGQPKMVAPLLDLTYESDLMPSLAVAPDGDIYVATPAEGCVRRMTPFGEMTVVAGVCGFPVDPPFDMDPPFDGSSVAEPVVAIHMGSSVDGTLVIAARGSVHRIDVRPADLLLGKGVVPSEDGSTLFLFDDAGRHARTVSALTNATLTEFKYDEANRLSKIIDADERETLIEHHGNYVELTAPGGQMTRLSLNSAGYAEDITRMNRGNESIEFEYHFGEDEGLLARVRTPYGSESTPEIHEKELTYHRGRLVEHRSGNDVQRLTRTDDGTGYTVTHVSPGNQVTEYRVESSNGLTYRTVKFPDGTTSASTVRSDGSTQLKRSDGTAIQFTKQPDPRFGMLSPYVSEIRIDASDAAPAGYLYQRTRTVEYDEDGYLVRQNDFVDEGSSRSYVLSYETDGSTHKWIHERPSKLKTEVRTDAIGRVLSYKEPGLTEVTFGYETAGAARGQLKQVTQGGRQYSLAYDSGTGLLSSVMDPLSQTTSLAYDTADRISSITFPGTGSSTANFTYDARGMVRTVQPPDKPNHTFTYTKYGLLESYKPPSVSGGPSGQQTFSYDPQRSLASWTREDEAVVSFDQPDGRPTSISTPRGFFYFSYDGEGGTLSSISSPGAVQTHYEWDGFVPRTVGWMHDGTAANVSFGYDAALRPIQVAVTDSGAAVSNVSFIYNDDGQLAYAGDMSFSYSETSGLLESTTLGNTADSYAWNGFGELTEYEASEDSNSLLKIEYLTRDDLGRITSKKETAGASERTWAYEYDERGRLTKVTEDDGIEDIETVYAYDANGNRLSVTVDSTPEQTCTYDERDRLVSCDGTTTFTYGPDGELQEKDDGTTITTYEYDVFGNLLAVEQDVGDWERIEYEVDAQNRRILRKVNDVVTARYVWQDQLRIAAELNADGSLRSRFVYGRDVNVPDYMISGANTYRLVKDHLGSVRLVVDVVTGDIAQELEYDAWGVVLSDSAPGFQPFGFAGGIYDTDTGLVRFGIREYSSGSGRWTSRDPAGFEGGQLNLDIYVDNDPLNWLDYTGEGREKPAATIGKYSTTYPEQHDLKSKRHVHWGEGDTPRSRGAVNFDGTLRHGKRPPGPVRRLLKRLYNINVPALDLLLNPCAVQPDLCKSSEERACEPA